MTYIAPKFGAVAPSSIDWPEMATVCFTPGVCPRDLFDLPHRFFGAGH